MKWETQNDLFESMVREESRILIEKGREYASKGDSLANFKRGKRVGITPLQRWWTFAEKHWNSIETFIEEGKTFSEETITGRINDARNYLFLLHCLIVDNEYPDADEDPDDGVPSCPFCGKDMHLSIIDDAQYWTCPNGVIHVHEQERKDVQKHKCPKCGNLMALSPNTNEWLCQLCDRKEDD